MEMEITYTIYIYTDENYSGDSKDIATFTSSSDADKAEEYLKKNNPKERFSSYETIIYTSYNEGLLSKINL